MKIRLLITRFTFVILLAASCFANASNYCSAPLNDAKVESTLSLVDVKFHRTDIDGFNRIVAKTSPESELWVLNPVRVVLEFLESRGARNVVIERCDARGESAKTSTITIIEDGYMDDSVRGTWYEFMLSKDESGRWLIKNGREAYRCWRGHHQDSYSMNNCE